MKVIIVACSNPIGWYKYKIIANYLINDLLRYWKNHSQPCLMSPDMFGSLVWLTEIGWFSKAEYKEILKKFFTDENYRNEIINADITQW